MVITIAGAYCFPSLLLNQWSSHVWNVNFITDSEEELKEKILATIHHCSNSHTFANNKYHKACGHGELRDEDRYKPWLDEGSEVSHKLAE